MADDDYNQLADRTIAEGVNRHASNRRTPASGRAGEKVPTTSGPALVSQPVRDAKRYEQAAASIPSHKQALVVSPGHPVVPPIVSPRRGE
jgi:hypothetical protein